MRTRFAGWSITKQAQEFNISTDTVSKYLKELDIIYDITQTGSIILPTRKKSKKETEMNKI